MDPRTAFMGADSRPDEHHEARGSPQRDDEGAEHRQRHEVREDPVTALSAGAPARGGRQVARLPGQRQAPATVKHLKKPEVAISG